MNDRIDPVLMGDKLDLVRRTTPWVWPQFKADIPAGWRDLVAELLTSIATLSAETDTQVQVHTVWQRGGRLGAFASTREGSGGGPRPVEERVEDLIGEASARSAYVCARCGVLSDRDDPRRRSGICVEHQAQRRGGSPSEFLDWTPRIFTSKDVP